MRILVTGASGHVGTCLVNTLLEQEYDVSVLVHKDSAALKKLPLRIFFGDILDIDSLKPAFADQDIVVHLAAFISVQQGHDQRLQAVNVEGVRNVAKVALDSGIKKMVHVSSVHAYDTYRLGRPLIESDGPATSPKHPPYDQSKAEGEKALREYIDKGLNAVILNPVGILGPYDDRPSLQGQGIITMLKFPISIVPKGHFCWVDVRDVAQAVINSFEKGRTGENYLLSGGSLDITSIVRLGAYAKQQNQWIFSIAISSLARLVPLIQRFGKRFSFSSQFTHDALYTLGTDLTVDASKAERDLDIKWRNIETSVIDAIRWLKDHGKL
ncbi:MAG: hypothetical protein COA99_16155 [Moraxellaceae bacterium]|nr:MAG: hypothetical protein COA99_16155 [Moraxellaceae bacterium]